MIWTLSHRADVAARKIADRHYNRQSIGAAGFVPPGRCLVLYQPGAFWVTSWPFAEYTHHAWPGAWVCSAFRAEGAPAREASGMIAEALAATVERWPAPPSIPAWRITRRHDRSDVEPIRVAMVTIVDPSKVRAKRDPGRCFRRAGFVEIGRTKVNGLTVLGLPVESVPRPMSPIGTQTGLFT